MREIFLCGNWVSGGTDHEGHARITGNARYEKGKGMRYQCLVLDHDDTVVNSTATVNFPAFLETLGQLRPGAEMTLEQYFRYNFDPGFTSLCYDLLSFTEEEMQIQVDNWAAYVRTHAPEPFDGMRELLWRFHNEGGHICVSSHSMRENILRDYALHGFPEPELIFGWDLPANRRKPSPYGLEQIMEQLHLLSEELVMVDDLKPGKDMADAAGVDFIAAGWAHQIPEIADFMRRECSVYCASVRDLEKFLFE